MVIAHALNMGWGLVVLLGFVCLGRIMARLAHPNGDWGVAMAAGWGMAGMVALGGWMTLLGLARPPFLIGLVVAVILLDLLYEGRRFFSSEPRPPVVPREPTGRASWIWLVVFLGVVAVKYEISVVNTFSIYDDTVAYLLELARMLQTGSQGPDPFSERLMLALNGQTFLLGLVCAVSPYHYAFLLDPGVCEIMIAGLIWFFVRRDLGGSVRETSIAAALVVMITVPDTSNLGGNMTGTVLYLTLLWTACWGCREKGHLNLGATLLLACTAAALCAIKTTFLTYTAMFLAFWYASRLWHSRRLSIVREMCLVGLVTLALLAPWMWQQYRSSGTPLYPMLGTGYHAGTGGSPIFGESLKSKLYQMGVFVFEIPAAPFFLAVALMACEVWEDRCRWRLFTAAAFSAMLASLLLAFQIANFFEPALCTSDALCDLDRGGIVRVLPPAVFDGRRGPGALPGHLRGNEMEQSPYAQAFSRISGQARASSGVCAGDAKDPRSPGYDPAWKADTGEHPGRISHRLRAEPDVEPGQHRDDQPATGSAGDFGPGGP